MPQKIPQFLGKIQISYSSITSRLSCLGSTRRSQVVACLVWSSHRATSIWELMCMDLCGPMKNITLGDVRYFMYIIDNFSCKIWVYLIAEKSQAFTKFQAWAALVESKTIVFVGHYVTWQSCSYCETVGFMNSCEWYRRGACMLMKIKTRKRGITKCLMYPSWKLTWMADSSVVGDES